MGESLRLVDVLTRTGAWLRSRGIESPRLEAELLLCHVLKMERLQLYLAHDRPMTEQELAELRPFVQRRGNREPMAWILGSKGFHAIDLHVIPGVLVPRPDTEALVNAALEWIPADADPVYLADVGCGSGAVGLAIAAAHPGVRVYATDISENALSCARSNVEALDLSKRVAVLEGDLLTPIPSNRPVDWVVSNPPYIPSRVISTLQPEVSQHEPKLALDGGRDGLACYKRLIPIAAKRARQGVLVEVGHDQAAAVIDIFKRAGLHDCRTWDDLGGIARVVGGLTG